MDNLKYGEVQQGIQPPHKIGKLRIYAEGFLFGSAVMSVIGAFVSLAKFNISLVIQNLSYLALYLVGSFLVINQEYLLSVVKGKNKEELIDLTKDKLEELKTKSVAEVIGIKETNSSIAATTTTSANIDNEYLYLDHSVRLGVSTGTLAARGHTKGLAANQIVEIPFANCCQNFVAFGGTGEGKTTCFINNLFIQLLVAKNKSFGGLVFDIKGNDFVVDAQNMANTVDRELKILGVKPGQLKINLLNGLNPALATDFLKSAYILGSGARDDGDVWIKSALLLTRNVLKILTYTKNDYTIKGLYQFIFIEDERNRMLNEANSNHSPMTEPDEDFVNALKYYEVTYSQYNDKLRSSVEFTLSPILEPFQSVELANAFSNNNADDNYDLANILNNGDVVCLDLPLTKYSEAGKLIYTMVKLRFYNLVKSRFDKEAELNSEKYVFFLCDEFQDILVFLQIGEEIS